MSGSQEPEISIFIPAYNAERFVHEAIESAVTQGLSSYEIVVGDDASTDRTQERCEATIRRFPDAPIRYHRNERNLGGGGNRNACARRCRGTYLLNLDADDIL